LTGRRRRARRAPRGHHRRLQHPTDQRRLAHGARARDRRVCII